VTDTPRPAIVRVWIVPVGLPPATLARCRAVLDDRERARAASFLSESDRRQFTVAHGFLRILAGLELGASPAALRWDAGPHGKPGLAAPWSELSTSLSHSAGVVAVALAAGRAVGVDVERLARRRDAAAMAARFYPPDEAAWVAGGRDAGARAGEAEHVTGDGDAGARTAEAEHVTGDGDAGARAAEAAYVTAHGDAGARADRFTWLWSRKEAVVKAAGGRLWPNLGIAVLGRDLIRCAEPDGEYRLADVPAPVGFRAAVALAGAAPFAAQVAIWPSGAAAAAVTN